jgi:methylglutaconyl-CoA hydratase
MANLLESIDSRGVATLTLNRPDRRNALDGPLVDALRTSLVRLDARTDIRLVVIAASGEIFCAGADIEWMKRLAGDTQERNKADALSLAELLRVLDLLSKPTIALVHGAVYGGGVGLVACCDVALASERARFCLSEVRLGVIPAIVGPFVVRSIGQRQARRFALTAELIFADKALEIGLVHEVCRETNLQSACESVIETMLRAAPGAQAEAKSLMARCYASPIDDALMKEAANRLALRRASDEGREGLSAFLEGRPPSWLDPRTI